MSWEVTALIRSRKAGSPTAKSILLVFADVANHDGGGIWLSKPSIAAETEVGINTVRRHIKDLVARGILLEVGRRKCSNGFTIEYDMDLEKIKSLELTRPKMGGVSLEGGDTTSPEGGDTPSQEEANSNKQSGKDPSEKSIKDIFEKLWKIVLDSTPTEIKGRHSKKKALAAMKRIATRKKEPIPASRIAHACLWFYSMPQQHKKDNSGQERGYMKALDRVIGGELFGVYLEKGVYDQVSTREESEAAAWKLRADFCNSTGGEWPPAAPDPRTCPAEYRNLFNGEHWEALGWK